MDYLKPPRQFNRHIDRHGNGLWLAAKALPSSWTPASAVGIREYWDFSDTSKITQVAGAVSSVTGQMGLYNLVQATGANKPVSGTRTINGLNTLDFNGTTHYLSTVISTNAFQPLTYFVVYQNDDVAGTDQRIVDTSGSRVLLDGSGDTGHKRYFFAGSTLVHGTALPTTNAEHMVCIYDGASSQMWLNGVSDASGTSPGSNGITGGQTMFIGQDGSGAGYFDGRIAFVGLIAGSMGAGDRTSWGTYCARWGL